MSNNNEATLELGEPHPCAQDAFKYVIDNLNPLIMKVTATTAIEGNRISQIVLSTFNRINNDEEVSDRYILGAAWYIKRLKEVE